jgi:hypothetical protein
MLVAQAQYKDTITLQGALIRILKRRTDYAITANIGGEDDGAIPAWVQTATTEHDARLIGNAFHKELKARYGMTRIA